MFAGDSAAAAAAPLGTHWTQVVSYPVLFADAPRLPPPPSSSSSSPGSRSAVNVSGGSALSPAAGGMRIEGLGASKGGGPAFVGQVFSMCDPSGSGLMAVTTHVQIPFLTSRTPKWIKRLVNVVAKNEKEGGPVFRFFMDLSDAVSYVKKLNVPTGMVGACRLDVAYEHFKEKPNMFQFVPNKKQVKEANKLLKTVSGTSRRRKMSGVPVFTAQNLNIAIATSDGVKWYSPYFFDKGLLDNILEASIDQHFQTLIQNRHMQRRRDVIDDSFSSEGVDDLSDNIFEPSEIHEMMDELGHPSIPLSVLSKAAEIKFLDVVDKAVLGNRWLRKATGIQPKFPYMVDSFEGRSTASVSKTKDLAFSAVNAEESFTDSRDDWKLSRVGDGVGCSEEVHVREKGFQFPFGGWSPSSWMKFGGVGKCQCNEMESSTRSTSEDMSKVLSNPLLPRITMVGISTSDGAPMSKSNLRKTMEDLTKELEQPNQQVNEVSQDMDPLFVANVGDYSTLTKSRSM